MTNYLSVAIEEQGVALLEIALRQTKLLQPNISKNDKTPIWDGEIFIKNKISDKKENIVGRVPVQVKSHQGTVLEKHSLEVTDLKKMLNDQGAIFFAVFLDNSLNNPKIKYHLFTPLELEKILQKKFYKNGKQKKTLSFNLTDLPENNDLIYSIFVDFWKNCRKQISLIDVNKPTLEEIQSGRYKNHRLYFNITGKKDIDYIFEYQKYSSLQLYLEDPETHISLPVISDVKIIEGAQSQNLEIGISDEIYFSRVERLITQDKILSIKFGEGFTIIINNDSIKVKFVRPSLLKNAIYEIDFLLKMYKEKMLSISGANGFITRW